MAAKIPRAVLTRTELTFLSTYLRRRTEDRMLIYADDQGNHQVVRPEASRQRGSVTCDVPLTIEQHGHLWDLVFDLHSHHVMGAFWSGTDDANERLRGPVFGVCSWQGCWPPVWLFRRFDGHEFVELSAQEVIADG